MLYLLGRQIFLTYILKLHSSWCLSGNFQVNVGCFKIGQPILDAAYTDLALLTVVSVSLTAIITALVVSVAAYIMACAMLCSNAITS